MAVEGSRFLLCPSLLQRSGLRCRERLVLRVSGHVLAHLLLTLKTGEWMYKESPYMALTAWG